jgi:hypothetical protein
MKVLVIPDVHLKPELFDRADELLKADIAERAVCLMDLADDFGQEYNILLYERTYDCAIRFQKDHPDTLWCYGNHDLSYVWNMMETGYSVFAISTVASRLNKLKSELPSLDSIAFVHRIDNVLFAHGGLTEDFVNTHVDESKRGDPDRVIRSVNRLIPEIMWSSASPLWFRPQYSDDLLWEEHIYIQVVGHTPVKYTARKGAVISCDVFSTYKDKTPIGTCEFPVIDTVTGEFESIK